MISLAAAAAEGHGGAHSFSWWAVVIAVVLLILNGFFVAAEIALLAARRARIEEQAETGDRRARLALSALKELSVTFSGAQLGITMASLGLGAVAEPAVAALFEGVLEDLGLPDSATVAVSFGLALAVVVFLHMVVGEMAPKNLALANPEAVSLRLAVPFRAFVVAFRPLILLLNSTANVVIRLVGVEPVEDVTLVHTPDELLLALRESRRHGWLDPQEARVMTAALTLRDIDAEAAMTPRVDLVSLPDTATAAEALELARRSGHTRLPVTHEDIDHVVGLVNVKDLLVREAGELPDLPVSEVLRPIVVVPESRDLEALMRDMRLDRSHAVLVVDEFGGTAGMLTLEDILEELVGEIEDEFDLAVGAARKTSRGWIVDGTMRRDELRRLTGFELPEATSETVSGHLTEYLGRLLNRGDSIEIEGWRLIVRTMEGHRAGRVEVIPPPPTPDQPQA